MKYFVNSPYTAETLKKEFRELSKKLHPDTGGNADDFKEMLNEYEETARNLSGTREHAAQERAAQEARQRAEERRREEEEERREWEAEQARQRAEWERQRKEEEERKAKARPLYEARCKKWAHLMEDLGPYYEAEKKAHDSHGWRSPEYKAAESATRAARRRNLLKMAKTAFPGVKFSLTYDNGWGGGYTVAWTDGPSVEEFEKATDFDLFVKYWDTFDGMTDCADIESADFTDFAEKYNGLSGRVEFSRKISEANRQKIEEVLIKYRPDLGKNDDEETRKRYNLGAWDVIKVSISSDELRDIFRLFGADFDTNKDRHFRYESFSLETWVKKLADYFSFKTDNEKKTEKAAGPAEFSPRYGAALRMLHKLTGVTLGDPQEGREFVAFFYTDDKKQSHTLSILEAVERLEQGQPVAFGSVHTGKDGHVSHWGIYNGGYKVQKARADKFAAQGYTIKGAGYLSTYGRVNIDGLTPETAAAIRADLADIERQRAEFEKGETAKAEKATKKAHKAEKSADPDNTKADTQKPASEPENAADGVDLTKAPAEGLRLEEIPGGVAVVADDWKTTYFNKRYIKAHGAHWNKQAKRWEATDPADVLRLRAWFVADIIEEVNAQMKTAEEIRREAAEEIRQEAEPSRMADAETTETTEAPDYSEAENVGNPDDQETATASEADPEPEPEHKRPARTFTVEIMTNGGVTARPFTSEDQSEAAKWMAAKVEELKQTEGAEVLTEKKGRVIYKDAEGYHMLYIYDSNEFQSMYWMARHSERRRILRKVAEKHAARMKAKEEKAAKAQETTANDEQPTATDKRPQISPIIEALADFFASIAKVAQMAAKYEGVTIRPDTLKLWREEVEKGARVFAEQLASCCACLSSLTPEARQDFDALGVIFWTLSDQLRQGTDPATIAPAVDYARAQLFDLVGRTQTPQQADLIREIFDRPADPKHKEAA